MRFARAHCQEGHSTDTEVIFSEAAPLEIEIGTPSQSTEVLDLELCAVARPVGLLLLLGQVPTLDPFRALGDDTRLWMRWVEPEEPGLEAACIEIAASTPRDERTRTARVVARATMTDRAGAWALYQRAEMQGLIDLHLFDTVPADGSPGEMMIWFVCADLSRRSAEFGLSVDPFPKHYL